MDNKSLLYLILSFITILIPIILTFYLKVPGEIEVISVYGIYAIFYMIIQMTFAFLNRRIMENVSQNIENGSLYNVLIVGYREDPVLFRACLKSHLIDLDNDKIKQIFVIIDGDEEEDIYMADIFSSVFTTGMVTSDLEKVFSTKAVCILQPHAGKRHVLYTGLKISCDTVDGTICTDSDTEYSNDAVNTLINTLESSDEYGAVTGYMEISNPFTILSTLSYIRYWFSCNLERAYQSYNGCVLCVSGPIGVYKNNVIKESLEDFITQTFLGKECTYGDDRHLSNIILSKGKKIVYTHKATCKTDTPESIFRFFNQQVRWCKSSYRELGWTIPSLHMHSIWLTIDIAYQVLYSLVVIGSLSYIVFFQESRILCFYFATVFLLNTVKGVYAFCISKNPVLLLYSWYGLVYIFSIIPAKIYAGLNMSDTKWGTSSRFFKYDAINSGNVILVGWTVFLISGILYNLIKGLTTTEDYWFLFGILLFMGIQITLLYIVSINNIRKINISVYC